MMRAQRYNLKSTAQPSAVIHVELYLSRKLALASYIMIDIDRMDIKAQLTKGRQQTQRVITAGKSKCYDFSLVLRVSLKKRGNRLNRRHWISPLNEFRVCSVLLNSSPSIYCLRELTASSCAASTRFLSSSL